MTTSPDFSPVIPALSGDPSWAGLLPSLAEDNLKRRLASADASIRRQAWLTMIDMLWLTLQLDYKVDANYAPGMPLYWCGRALKELGEQELLDAADTLAAQILDRRQRREQLTDMLVANRRRWGWRQFFFGPLKDPQL